MLSWLSILVEEVVKKSRGIAANVGQVFNLPQWSAVRQRHRKLCAGERGGVSPPVSSSQDREADAAPLAKHPLEQRPLAWWFWLFGNRDAQMSQRGGSHDSTAGRSLQESSAKQERFDFVFERVGRATHAVRDCG